MSKTTERLADECTVALISRIDYGSDGFRKGLLDLAAHHVRAEDARVIVFAGGLVSKRAIAKKQRRYRVALREIRRQTRDLEKERVECTDQRRTAIDKQLKRLELEEKRFQGKLRKLDPELIAESLARLIPRFETADGKKVKIYFSASEAYDGPIGEEVAQILARLRGGKDGDFFAYKPNADILEILQSQQRLEFISPSGDRMLMRSDYASTHADRTAKDAESLRQGPPPDVQVIGSHGVNVTRPLGESPQPYFTVPVLHKPEATRGSENQIGMRFLLLKRGRIDPIVRTYSYNDYVQNELENIAAPPNASPAAVKIVDALKEHGSLTIGRLEDITGLARTTVERTAKSLVRTSSRVLKTWPGLVMYQDSQRVAFNHDWIRYALRYKPFVGACQVDRMVGCGCVHAGSINTDYFFLLDELVRVIIDTGATSLHNCGDLVEGIKHNLERRGELLPGLGNYTKQEKLIAAIHADIACRVFTIRFGEWWKSLGGKTPSTDQLRAAVEACLIETIYICGNHDDWQTDDGHTPLEFMEAVLREKIRAGVDAELAKLGVAVPGLTAIVQRKVMRPFKGRLTLRSGVRMTMLHPGMPRALTTSARLEQALRMERRWGKKKPGAHVVMIANFHTAAGVETRAGELGQRVGVQIGTGKHDTGFERGKLKVLDQGIAHLAVHSNEGRILMTEIGFYGNEPTDEAFRDPYEYLRRLYDRLKLKL